MHPRSWYETLRRSALAEGSRASASALLGLRNAQAGTPLDDRFPAAEMLRRAGFEAREDLVDLTAEELRALGLGFAEADAVLAALGAAH